MSTNFKLTWMKEGNIMKYAKTIGTVFLLASLLAACGGGGGGGGGGTPSSGGGGLATGTFVKEFGPVDNGNNTIPFDATPGIKAQYLYYATDITGSGYISAIRFRRSATSAAATTCPEVWVRMGHTSLTALTTAFADNVDRGSMTVVSDEIAINIPAGAAGTWFDVPLEVPFNYNGVDNLVVEVSRAFACSAMLAVDYNNTTPVVRRLTGTPAADTGTPDTFLNFMQFVFAGGDDRVTYPASIGEAIPFGGSSTNRHAQMLHLASDLNGSGPITGIAMIISTTGAPTVAVGNTVNIKLGHTTRAVLTDNFADNFNSGAPVTVASGLTFNVPAGVPAGTPIWLPLSGSFNYNGTDNLIVDIEVTPITAGGTFWSQDDTIADRRLYAAVGAARGTVTPGAYHTVFRFHGAPVQVMPLTNLVINMVLGSSSPGGQIQNLYDSTSLGTGGRITNVAVRLSGATPVATSLVNYKVYMGHTAKTQYNVTETYASNMDENMLVFNGTLTIPADLKQGDWVTVPLQTPFTYDPSKNLSILFTSDFGVAGNSVSMHSDATRFPVHAGYRADNAVDTSGTPSWILDGAVNVQLKIEK